MYNIRRISMARLDQNRSYLVFHRGEHLVLFLVSPGSRFQAS